MTFALSSHGKILTFSVSKLDVVCALCGKYLKPKTFALFLLFNFVKVVSVHQKQSKSTLKTKKFTDPATT